MTDELKHAIFKALWHLKAYARSLSNGDNLDLATQDKIEEVITELEEEAYGRDQR
jgi:hypothetical protein